MITYLVKRREAWTVADFLRGWGRAVADRFRVLPYEDLGGVSEIEPGLCIFSDIDRLGPREVDAASELRRQLLAASGVRPLNDPARSLRRLELLSLLHRQGINTFRAYRVTQSRRPERFPVFLRYENEHWGAISPLLHSQAELDRALACACVLYPRPRDLLIVEFCDTRSADGLYRKYSAFIIDGQTVPRDLIFDRGWLQKDIAIVTPETIAEERDYVETNPHEGALLAVAEMAGIEYGRIDYGFAGGELQVWEINTNPIICKLPEAYRGDHVANQASFAARMAGRLEALAEVPPDRRPVPVSVPAAPARHEATARLGGLYARVWDVLRLVGHSRAVDPILRLLERVVGSLHRPLQPFVARRLRSSA